MRKTLRFNVWMKKLVRKNRTMRIFKTVSLLMAAMYLSFNSLNAQITVPNYTACPGQPLVVTATWNNVSNISYTLSPSGVIQISNPNFTITTPSVSTQYTICAAGSSLGLPTNSCAQFTVFITPAPPLTITHNINYCHGDNAILTALVGGVSYSVSGPPGVANIVSPSNVITIPNLSAVPHTGNYTVTTLLGGCLSTGVTPINVAPNHQIAINSPSTVCLGEVVNLTASLLTATNVFVWSSTSGYNSPPFPASFACTSTSFSGVYTAVNDIVFNGITCQRSATTSITVVQTSPVNAGASPSQTICEGSNITLTAFTSTGAVQGYSWLGPQGYSSSLQSPVLNAAVPNVSGTYSVTALFFNSAKTCTTGAVVTISVVGVAQPIVAATPDLCQFGTATFSVNAPGAVAYNWSGPNNFTSPQSYFVINNIQPNQAGIYFVSASFNGGTSINCITTKSVQVNVVTTNSVSVIPPGQVCQPNNANLQANAIGASSYVWTGPNGFGPIPTANAIVYYPTPASSGIYTVIAYFVSGITCTSSATASLTVNPLLNFTLSPYQVICYNTPLNINGPAGGTSYSWTSSSGFASNDQNIAIPSAQPNLSGSYTLNVALGPCVTTGTTLVDILTPIQFTLTPNDRTICRGDTIYLEGGVIGGSQNYAYNWIPAVYLTSSNGPIQKGVPLGSTIYNLVAFDNACPNYSVTHSFSVNVKQPPVPSFTFEAVEGCAPLCLVYTTSTQGDPAITTYDFGGLDVFQSDTTFNKCFTAPGSYTMKVTSLGTNGCVGKYTFPVPFEVHPRPGTSIFWEPESPTVTDNIILNTTNVIDPIMYTWTIANANLTGYDTSNQVSPTVIYDVAGKYPVNVMTITDKGCIDTVSRLITVRDDYNVFIPNTFTPNNDGLNDFFTVVGSGFKPEGFVMEITDRWGKLVYTSTDVAKGWDGTINGQKCKDGTYIYKIRAVGANGEGRKEYIGYVNLLQ